MTSPSENFEHDKLIPGSVNQPPSDLDRFELISAYIDDELSALEKQQVQGWLDNDPQSKALYMRLLALQSQIQTLEVPVSNCSADEITGRVFQSLERRRHLRRLALGSSAVAATVVATIMGLVPGSEPGWRLAQSPNPGQNTANEVMLAVALDKPAIDIPKSLNGYAVER
ncbi:MAG: zf-HC2 domain-containing protein [Cyanobacteria bacterium J06623_7]